LPAFGFAVHAFTASTSGRFCWFAFWRSVQNALDEHLKPMKGIFFILFLGAVLLSFYDDNAFFGDAAIAQIKQPFFK
jgi:hypothetical protein